MTTLPKINYADCFEDRLHHHQVDASSLGWAPGSWPDRLTTDDMGNRMAFQLVKLDHFGAEYRQLFGCLTLTVFNS